MKLNEAKGYIRNLSPVFRVYCGAHAGSARCAEFYQSGGSLLEHTVSVLLRSLPRKNSLQLEQM